jgi:hypothetical protein
MKPARDEVDMWVDLGGFGNDALNARMRTANYQHDAIRRAASRITVDDGPLTEGG